jgi:hypothetical protein
MFILIYDVMFSERRHTCTRLRIFQMDLKQYLFFYYFNNIASMDAFLLSICIHVQYWEGILNKALIKVLLQFCLVFCNFTSQLSVQEIGLLQWRASSFVRVF